SFAIPKHPLRASAPCLDQKVGSEADNGILGGCNDRFELGVLFKSLRHVGVPCARRSRSAQASAAKMRRQTVGPRTRRWPVSLRRYVLYRNGRAAADLPAADLENRPDLEATHL